MACQNCNTNVNCRCVMPNKVITFYPAVILNDIDCPLQPPTVTLWVNDVVVDSTLWTGGETLEYTFTEAGDYVVKMCVQNCCGTCCTAEEVIHVGESIQLQQVNCKQYQLVDTRTNLVSGRIDVRDLNGNILESIVVTTDTTLISVSYDGIYFVDYFYTLDDGLGEQNLTFFFIEFCTLTYCYKKLFLEQICNKPLCGSAETVSKYLRLQLFFMAAELFLAAHFSLWVETNNTWIYERRFLRTLEDMNKYLQSALVVCVDCGINTDTTTVEFPQMTNTNVPEMGIPNNNPTCCS